jgi:xanthosine utilization system XapX-like protein
MLLVQVAVRSGGRGSVDAFLRTKFRRVDLGLDVAWDAYICLGTFLFSWNMLRHPRFGRIFGGLVLLLSAGLAVLNLAAFPAPPAYAGLIDLGPFVGLWYVAVSIQLLRSRPWAASQLRVAAEAHAV